MKRLKTKFVNLQLNKNFGTKEEVVKLNSVLWGLGALVPIKICVFFLFILCLYRQNVRAEEIVEPLIPSSYKVAEIRQVTKYLGDENTTAYFSPDGSKIVYQLKGKVWIMNADGSGKMVIGDGRSPEFSPDGSSIVYEEFNKIILYDISNKDKKIVIEKGKNPHFVYPGDFILFQTLEDLNENIWLVDLAGDNLQEITHREDNRKIIYYTISPTGNLILYTTAVLEEYSNEIKWHTLDIWAINIDGTMETRLVSPGNGGMPVFSPSGTEVAFVCLVNNEPYLWVGNLAEGRNIFFESLRIAQTSGVVSPFQHLPRKTFFHLPAWSSQGDKIVTVNYDEKNLNFQVVVYDTKGSKLVKLVSVPGFIKDIKWSSDGKTIVYTAGKLKTTPSVMAIWTINFYGVSIDNEPVYLKMPPLKKGETFLVPAKEIMEKMEANLEWEEKQKKLIILHPSVYLEVKPGDHYVLINGEKQRLSIPAQIIAGRLYLPLEFIVQVLDAKVIYNQDMQTYEVMYRMKE